MTGNLRDLDSDISHSMDASTARTAFTVLPRRVKGTWDFVCIAGVLMCSLFTSNAQPSTNSVDTVRGVVVDSVTNRPIPRAEVILNQEQAALTGQSGQFEFDHVLLRENLVIVRKPGYLDPALNDAGGPPANTADPSIISLNAQHRIQVDRTHAAITLKLTRTASISGHITLSGSQPLVEIEVAVYKRQTQNGRPHWNLAGTATTKSDGLFRVGNLSPGKYMLYTLPSFGVSDSGVEGGTKWGYGSVYYPGVTDPSLMSTVNLAPGQAENVELTLKRQRFYPLTAAVQVSSTGAMASFQILDRSGRPTNIPVSYDAQQQLLHAIVPSGLWILEGHAFDRKPAYGRIDFRVAHSPVSLAINILPLTSLSIIVRREQQPSAEVRESRTLSTGPGVILNLSSVSEFGGWGALRRQLHAESDQANAVWAGTIDASPGQYWVDAVSWAGYVTSITSGGVDLTSSPINVSSGASLPPIEIDLRKDTGRITGRIGKRSIRPSNSSEESDLYVYAIPLSSTASQVGMGSIESGEQFTISNLAPGSYRVVACDRLQNIDFHSAEGLAEWQGKGQIVSVDAGGTTRVQIEVIHSGLTQ